MRAGKLGTLKEMRSPAIPERLLALQRLVFEDPTLETRPGEGAVQGGRSPRSRTARRSRRAAHRRRRGRARRSTPRWSRGTPSTCANCKLEALREDGRPRDAGDAEAARRISNALDARGLARAALDVLRPKSLGAGRRPGARDQGAASRSSRRPIRSTSSSTVRPASARRPSRGSRSSSRRSARTRRSPPTRRSSRRPARRCAGTTARRRTRCWAACTIRSIRARRRDFADSGVPEPKLGLVTQGARRRAVHRRDRRDGSRDADAAAQGARGQARHVRVVVLRRARSQRPGLREEAVPRRRAGGFRPDRRDDARSRGDRRGDPLALRGGVLRAAHPGAGRAHRDRSGAAAGREGRDAACRN